MLPEDADMFSQPIQVKQASEQAKIKEGAAT